MACDYFKDLAKITVSDKSSRDTVFEIAKCPKYERHQQEIVSITYNFLIKNSRKRCRNKYKKHNYIYFASTIS